MSASEYEGGEGEANTAMGATGVQAAKRADSFRGRDHGSDRLTADRAGRGGVSGQREDCIVQWELPLPRVPRRRACRRY